MTLRSHQGGDVRSGRPEPGSREADYRSGIASSLVAEAVFVAVGMGMLYLRGGDPWHIVRASASLVFGPDVASPPDFVPGDVARGAGMHVAYSLVTGAVYATLLPRLRLTPVQGGLVAGGVLYLLGTWLLPAALGDWVAPMRKSGAEKIVAAGMHVLYGVVFGVAYRVISERRRR